MVLLSLRLPFVLNLNYFKSCLGETVVTSLRNIMQLFWLNTTDNLRSQVKRTQHCCCNLTCSLPNDQINVALKFDRSKKICDIVQYRTTLGNKRGRTVLHYANTTKSHDMNCCNGSTRGRLYKTLNHFSITVFNHFSITVFNHFLITVFNHFLITALLLNSDYCDLRSSLRRAVSKRTFAVSKRTFAVSKQTVLTGLMLSFNNEIDTLSRFERNVWILYSK